MIDRQHDLPIGKQAKAVNISRGSVYYLPRPVTAADLAIMRRMDELHLDFPFAGSRMLRDLLNAEGIKVGRRHVATLMRRMGIEAIYRKPNTSRPAPGHKIYPAHAAGHPAGSGLGDGHHIHPDGARLRLSRRRRRLVQPPGSCLAIVDHYGGGVLHRSAGGRSRPPRQAGDLQHGPRQSVHQLRLHRSAQRERHRHQHGRQGLVFVERLWRSIKYEEVYLRAYDTVSEARASIGRYLGFYNPASLRPSRYVVEENRLC
jgi:putative transposase